MFSNKFFLRVFFSFHIILYGHILHAAEAFTYKGADSSGQECTVHVVVDPGTNRVLQLSYKGEIDIEAVFNFQHPGIFKEPMNPNKFNPDGAVFVLSELVQTEWEFLWRQGFTVRSQLLVQDEVGDVTHTVSAELRGVPQCLTHIQITETSVLDAVGVTFNKRTAVCSKLQWTDAQSG
jgi:hypothetical protein